MDKNWLIRTKSNHILGPVSKEKVQELYRNGSIKPDDEICSGNGFWFFIREDEIVSKYLLGDDIQGFNPVSEAKDVLTNSNKENSTIGSEKEHITLVGGIPLSIMNSEPELPSELEIETPTPVAEELSAPKKKSRPQGRVRQSYTPKQNNLSQTPKKQNYLKWLGIFGFIILFCLIYFRKTIIRSLFNGEMSQLSISIVGKAHAQEIVPFKKKLLDRKIVLDEMTFHAAVGLSGFRVTSTFNIGDITCDELSNEVHQLGIILYPPELINEKFLIKIRECMIDMPEKHPLKRWLKSIAQIKKRTVKEQKTRDFLSEVLNSKFNLITDPTQRTKIVNHLIDVPESSMGERLLKSYLYLIIGNVTKSDNLLKAFINRPPYENWKGFSSRQSLYFQLASEYIEQIVIKLAKHPADRKIYQLFSQYIVSFYQNESLLRLVAEHQTTALSKKLDLKFIKRLSPELVDHLNLKLETEAGRMTRLRNINEHPLNEQAYWHWPFFEIDPLISKELVHTLQRIEQDDQLWFIYLMSNEKLIDAYSKESGKSFLPGRRQYLRSLLDEREDFMLAIFKLIEFGDIDQNLIRKTINFLTNG